MVFKDEIIKETNVVREVMDQRQSLEQLNNEWSERKENWQLRIACDQWDGGEPESRMSQQPGEEPASTRRHNRVYLRGQGR